MKRDSNTPITDIVYGLRPQQRSKSDKKKEPPRRLGSPVHNLLDEVTLRKLARRYPRLKRYLP